MDGDGQQTERPKRLVTLGSMLRRFEYKDDTSSRRTTASPRQTRSLANRTEHGGGAPVSSARVAKVTRSRKKPPHRRSGYAPPSKYAHLKPLTDILEPDLICVFVGFNPGVRTATAGHAYAHPSNLFWKLLHRSGCTDRQLMPEEDVDLPRLYAIGNTNLVSRPTKSDAELSKDEQLEGVAVLDAKIRKYKPESVCIVGKSIWENIWRYKYGTKPSKTEFKHGWQNEKHNMGIRSTEDDEEAANGDWSGARVFVATSSSGLDASTKPAEKEAIWAPFGEWVQQRRKERAARQTCLA